MNNKQTPSTIQKMDIALLLLLVITFGLALSFIGLILSDAAPGEPSGSPQGLTTAFAFILVAPLLLIAGITSWLRVRKLRSRGQRIDKTITIAALATAALWLVWFFAING